jgi:hypothetical protein
MNTHTKQLVITDETVLAFYRENPNIDITSMNLVFIDVLKKLSTNLTETLVNTVNSKILNTLTQLSGSISDIKHELSNISRDMISQINTKLHENKKEHIETMNMILTNNSLSNYEKIGSIIDKQNETLISKTTSIISEVVPKTHELYNQKIESTISSLSNVISERTTQLIETSTKDNPENAIKEYLKQIESYMDKTVHTIQQPIYAFIQSSEQRTIVDLQLLKEKLISQNTSQDTLSLEIREFLNKYKYNSSIKGNVSETELYYILQQLFPTDEVLDCRGETATCDYRVNRLYKTKPTILFENKDYTRSANTEEVTKFCRDLSIQRTHGIFLSQNSNITYKRDFQIDIVDGLIHVYVCNVKYNREKIQIAVDIIDNLSQKMEYITQHTAETSGFHISKEDLEGLMDEYTEFNARKAQLVDIVRNSTKQTIEKIEELQLFALKRVLTRNGALQADDEFKCRFCNSFTGKNRASLGAHVRGCKFNPAKTANA